MLWKGRRQSENIEDRRGMRPRAAVVGGGGIGMLLLVLLVILAGGDPRALLEQVAEEPPRGGSVPAQRQAPVDPQEQELREFVGVVLADTEDAWHEIFRQRGVQYREPKLVLFRNKVESACGYASAAVGPFYCGADEKLYVDLSFYDDLKKKFGAPGDFAQAYVIAHEVGHHVQNLLGTMGKVNALQRRMSKEEANQLSVRLELQADFYAGVWAHHAQKMKSVLDAEDINEALEAATAIGDDRLQMRGQGYVVPESFTHGTSQQRRRWFKRGWDSGDLRQGDTFNVPNP